MRITEAWWYFAGVVTLPALFIFWWVIKCILDYHDRRRTRRRFFIIRADKIDDLPARIFSEARMLENGVREELCRVLVISKILRLGYVWKSRDPWPTQHIMIINDELELEGADQ